MEMAEFRCVLGGRFSERCKFSIICYALLILQHWYEANG